MPKAALSYIVAAVCAAPVCAQLGVVAVQPANGRIDPSAAIAITFDAPINAASVTAISFSVQGTWSGPGRGVRTLSPDQRTIRFEPTRPFFAGELVSIDLSRAITASNGTALPAGRRFEAWVRSAPGTRTFSNVATLPLRQAGEGRIGTYGIFAGDVDGDGSPDITSMNEISNDIRVQHNSGCGTFAPLLTVGNPGQWPSPNEGADFDRDGRIDLVTGNQNGGAVSVYRNDGAGSFLPPAVYATAGYVHGVATADFNGDGWFDVAAPNGSNVSVFLNLGNGSLGPPVTYDAGGNGEDNVSACDVDGDHVVDLVVGNVFSNNMGVLHGVGNGTFVLLGTFPTGGQPFHQACGDCNGDGRVDILFANRGTDTFAVLFGDGAGGFAPAVTYPVGQTPAAIDVGDIDGDGDLDCIVANYSSADYTLWWNRGDGVFVQPLTLAAAQAGSCSTLVDFDRDGIVDIIGADENADVAILYRQLGAGAPTAQPPSCAATLRVEQRGDRAGYGGTPAQPVRLGARISIGVSAPDGALAAVAFGPPWPPGFAVPGAGLIGIDLSVPPYFELYWLDGNGELTLQMSVPAALPPGLLVALQAAVDQQGQGFVLSNPQTVMLVP